MAGDAIDLAALDRDVRSAAARVEERRSLLALGTDGALARGRAFDPFDGLRHTATMTSYQALAEHEPSAGVDAPLRAGLRRWVHELLQARIGADLAVDDAEAAHALDSRLPPHVIAAMKTAAAARDLSASDDVQQGSHDEAHTYADAFAGIVLAPDAARAAASLERAGELASPVAAARKERRARRFEAARRLGLAHPFALATTSDAAALSRAVLDATDPLAVELRAMARKKSEFHFRASSAVQSDLARAAHDGWPAELTQRWLDDVFKALAPRGVGAKIALPRAIGGASFLRATVAWGFAWRTFGAPRSMPFALARDPYPAPALRFGYAMASVVGGEVFQRRALDLPARIAKAQSRTLRRTMFHHARIVAARALLASEETVSAESFEELGVRLFGAPLPRAMRDAWPEPRPDEPARLVALLGTRAFLEQLVDRFDEDWFRNPKAGTHLTSLACGPAFDADPVADASPGALARAFEDALG